MAHTDSCKIQVLEYVDTLLVKGFSRNKAFKETAKQSGGIGIPYKTIARWYYDIKKEEKGGGEEKKLTKIGQSLTDEKTPPVAAPGPDELKVDFSKGKIGGKKQPYIKIFFEPTERQLHIFEEIIKHLKTFGKDPGKEHENKGVKSFNMNLERFWDMVHADFEQKTRGGEIPSVYVPVNFRNYKVCVQHDYQKPDVRMALDEISGIEFNPQAPSTGSEE
jgi:hypothetical protein